MRQVLLEQLVPERGSLHECPGPCGLPRSPALQPGQQNASDSPPCTRAHSCLPSGSEDARASARVCCHHCELLPLAAQLAASGTQTERAVRSKQMQTASADLPGSLRSPDPTARDRHPDRCVPFLQKAADATTSCPPQTVTARPGLKPEFSSQSQFHSFKTCFHPKIGQRKPVPDLFFH